MKILDNIARKMGFVRKRRTSRGIRTYMAAKVNRLTNDWVTTSSNADANMRTSLKVIRARSRDLYDNNDYAKRFINMVVANVIGEHGIVFQNKYKNAAGQFDKRINTDIEGSLKEWGHKSTASVTGRLSWRAIQRLFISTVARDGEILIRKVKGADNPYGFSLQFLEADYLPEDLNQDLTNGNRIVMGVELDGWRKPVAYYLRSRHPGDYMTTIAGNRYDRIPADEIIHGFVQERPEQTRGVPWMVTAMYHMRMVEKYEEAELIAARVASTKMGFYKTPTGDDYVGSDVDASENKITEAEAGIFEELPKGTDFVSWDPQHPTSAFGDFVKSALRGVASGLNVSYNSLASDLEGVSYSSIRQGVLDERLQWRILQQWVVEELMEPVMEEWLSMAVLSGQVNLSPTNYRQFYVPKWQPRGWAWVDPLKDVKANIDAINFGVKTRSMVLAEQGLDIEDIYQQLADEQALAESYGLSFAGSDAGVRDLEDEHIELHQTNGNVSGRIDRTPVE